MQNVKTSMRCEIVIVEQIATARGVNPDSPRHLNKVTETL